MSENENNYFECLYCGLTFEDEEARDNHTFQKHMRQVEENLAKIQNIAEEHKEAIQDWRDEKRKELLLKIATERPQLLHEIQVSPHGSEILDHEIDMSLLKTALKTDSPSSFELLWLKHPRYAEFEKAQKEAKEPELPDASEAQKIIENTSKTENLSNEDVDKKKLVLILYSLLRNKKKD